MTAVIDGTSGITFPDATTQARGGLRQLAQIQSVTTSTVTTGTTAIPFDNTIPQITEGDQYMSQAITPTNINSTLEIDVVINLSNSNAAQNISAALFQDATANALKAATTNQNAATGQVTLAFKHTMTAGTISSTTFRVRGGAGTGATTTFNGQAGGQIFGGVMASSITIKEYLP